MKQFNEFKPNIKPTKSIIGLPSVLRNKFSYLLLVCIGVASFAMFFWLQSSHVQRAELLVTDANNVITLFNQKLADEQAKGYQLLDDYFYDDKSAIDVRNQIAEFKGIETMTFEQIKEKQQERLKAYEDAQIELENSIFKKVDEFTNQKSNNNQIALIGNSDANTFADNPEYKKYNELKAIKKPAVGLMGAVNEYGSDMNKQLNTLKDNIKQVQLIVNSIERVIEKSKLKKRESAPPAPPIEEKKAEVQPTDSKEEIKTIEEPKAEQKEEAKKPGDEKKAEAPKPKPQPKKPSSNVPVW